jgi:hypothetical protein
MLPLPGGLGAAGSASLASGMKIDAPAVKPEGFAAPLCGARAQRRPILTVVARFRRQAAVPPAVFVE